MAKELSICEFVLSATFVLLSKYIALAVGWSLTARVSSVSSSCSMSAWMNSCTRRMPWPIKLTCIEMHFHQWFRKEETKFWQLLRCGRPNEQKSLLNILFCLSALLLLKFINLHGLCDSWEILDRTSDSSKGDSHFTLATPACMLKTNIFFYSRTADYREKLQRCVGLTRYWKPGKFVVWFMRLSQYLMKDSRSMKVNGTSFCVTTICSVLFIVLWLFCMNYMTWLNRQKPIFAYRLLACRWTTDASLRLAGKTFLLAGKALNGKGGKIIGDAHAQQVWRLHLNKNGGNAIYKV